MEKSSERRKALWLSGIGSIVIVAIVYGSAWIIGMVFDQTVKISETTSTITSRPSNETTTSIGEMAFTTQVFNESRPYQLSLQTYVATSDSDNDTAMSQSFNNQVQQFVSNQRARFEDDLQFFLDTLNSPESRLEIYATDIKSSSPNEIEITYEINQFFAGDTSPTSSVSILEIRL